MWVEFALFENIFYKNDLTFGGKRGLIKPPLVEQLGCYAFTLM